MKRPNIIVQKKNSCNNAKKEEVTTFENNNVREKQCAKKPTCETIVQEATMSKECEELQQCKINDNNMRGVEVA